MLKKFQTATAIENQILDGVDYYKLIFEGKLSGYLAFYKKESFLFLSKIYVSKDYRGKKIGKSAMDFVQKKALDMNCKSIKLGVNRFNVDAIKAYKAMDFKITGEMITDIGNGFIMDDYKMEKLI